MQAAATSLQNRYEIVRPLAQGESGAVYEARDLRLGGSAVALKLCVFNSEAMREQFTHEASQFARLSHPHLPKVLDIFREGAGQYLVSEFVTGTDLEEALHRFGGKLDYHTVLAWADQLLDALSYLHEIEPPLIHRDIKPVNIKFTGQGHVMLLDFGFAKGHAGNLSAYGQASPFAPIEQIHNSGTDPRSDLYSLAATMYRLLTGTMPENALARLEAIAAQQPDPQKLASELAPAVPLVISQAVHHALSLNRETRYQSASEMRSALRLALKLSDETVAETAPQPSALAAPTKPATVAPPKPEPNPEPKFQPTSQPPPQTAHKTRKERPFVPPPIIVQPAPKATMTVPVPPANLLRRPAQWQFAAIVTVLLFGGTTMGLLAQQFLGRSSAEPPKNTVNAPVAPALPRQFVNRWGTQFTLVPAGTFTMGSANEPDAQPPHVVELTQPFYVSTYEITQQQWRTLMRSNPSETRGDELPVENVTWFDAQKFVAQLNLFNDGYRYRLPSEAEWEYAARAGNSEDAPHDLARFAWLKGQTDVLQPVGQKEPNAFGLYDMFGNVAEWCADAYHETYAGAPTDGEAWTAASGDKLFRVIRGESWSSSLEKVHAAYRNYDEPQNHSRLLGLRIVAEKLPDPGNP